MTDQDSSVKIYTVYFNNGQMVSINADKVEWDSGLMCFLHGENYVAQFHVDSVAGWVDASYSALAEIIYKAI